MNTLQVSTNVRNKLLPIHHLVVVSSLIAYKFFHHSSYFENIYKMIVPTLQMCTWDDLVQSFHPTLRYYFLRWNQVQINDVNFYGLFAYSYHLLENCDVNIKVSILHIGWILKFFVWQFTSWFILNYNRWIPWWHEYSWIKC